MMAIGKTGRSYDDACGTAHALELIGERWAMLVVRELLLGPRRFGDLRSGLPGISANVLTQRLEGLEASGIVRRRRLPPPASVQVYGLTDWGMETEPLILGLGKWAARSTLHDPNAPLSAVSLMLSMKTMFAPHRAVGETVTVSIRIGDDAYWAKIANGTLTEGRGEAQQSDVELSSVDPGVIAGVLHGFVDFATMEQAGQITAHGNRDILPRLIAMFEMPPKAVTLDAAQ